MLLGVINMVLWVISMLFWVISMLRMSDSWNYTSAHFTILIYIIVSSHQWHCRGAAYQVFQNSLYIAAHYLKWVGHLQEFRRNDTSLISGFGQKSGSDPNCATKKWVGVKTWCRIAAWLQSSLPSSTQIKLIPAARMHSSPPSSKQIQLMPAIRLQSRLSGSKLMKLTVTASLRWNLPCFKKIKPGCKASC